MGKKTFALIMISLLLTSCAMLFQPTREEFMDYYVKKENVKVGDDVQVCEHKVFGRYKGCVHFKMKSKEYVDEYEKVAQKKFNYDSCFYATKFDKYRGQNFDDARSRIQEECSEFMEDYHQALRTFNESYAELEHMSKQNKIDGAMAKADSPDGLEVCPRIEQEECKMYYKLFDGQSNYDERSTNEELMRIYKELQTYKVNYASLDEKYKAERSENKKRRLERDAKGLVRDYGRRYEDFVDTYERASRKFKQKKAEQDARNEAIAAAEKKIAQEKNRFISGPVSTVKIGSRVWTARNLLLAEGGCPEFLVKKGHKSYQICEKSRVDFYGNIQYDDCRGSYTMAQIKEKEWESCQKTGGLYTWSEAENACPDGFRLPTMEEVSTDLKKIEEDYDLQDKLFGDVTQKHADISFWTSTKLGVNYTVKYNLWWSNNNGLVHQNHFVTREAIAGVRCVKE